MKTYLFSKMTLTVAIMLLVFQSLSAGFSQQYPSQQTIRPLTGETASRTVNLSDAFPQTAAASSVVKIAADSYCIPAGTNATYYVDNFSTTGGLTNITNLGSGFSADGYGDFYDSLDVTMGITQKKGESVNFTASFGGGSAGFRVWVDWNQDGVFDNSEVAWSSISFWDDPQIGTITVPADALPGHTRMRIVSHWLHNEGDVEPCSTTHSWGEFEDYRFKVVGESGFVGDFSTNAVSYWQNGNGIYTNPPSVFENDEMVNFMPPNSPSGVLTLVSSNGGGGSYYFNGVEWIAQSSVNIEFDWNYSTVDGTSYDYFVMLVGDDSNNFSNNNFGNQSDNWTKISDIDGSSIQNGHVSLHLNPGQRLALAAFTTDGQSGSCTITISNFSVENSYTISTSSSPAAGGTTSGGGFYSPGSPVTVTATPNAGYEFKNWQEGGVVASTNPNYSFTASADRNLVAKFKKSTSNYTITTSSSPAAGGTTNGGGTYADGANIVVAAVPNPGYEFKNWQEGGVVVSTNPNYSFTVSADRTLVAKFKASSGGASYKITTKSTPSAGGTTTGDGNYQSNTKAILKAVANPGYKFVNWTIGGTQVSNKATYKHTVTGKATVVANFEALNYVIITKSAPAAGGTTTGGGSYAYNSKATLKAVANPGYKFVNWTIGGAQVSNKATYKHTVTGKATVVANFEALSYVITTKSAPNAGGVTTGGGTYQYNTKATLKAITNPGYTFVNWTIGGVVVSDRATYKHTVTGKATVVANFVSNIYAKENPNDEFSFNYYPNPVKDLLYIKTNRNIEAVQAYNLSGQQVMNLKMTEVIRGEINVSRLPSGIYIFKTVLDNGKVESFRVIKK